MEGEAISGDTGEPPRVIDRAEGCRFRRRCPYAIQKCSWVTLRPTRIGARRVACHVAVAPSAPPSCTSDKSPIINL
jgi:oligopeptide/dipeptide ABC transporter ATP-binding protein